jgi:SAM-dependent methyltransferase
MTDKAHIHTTEMTEVNRQWNTSLTSDFGKRRSELCKAKDFHSAWFRRWCDELSEKPNFHRKQWEFIYIAQALWERECLIENKGGLVFAVGNEPLPGLFAKYGCSILATDIQPETGIERGWNNGQLCFSAEQLNNRGLCPEEKFNRLVAYKPVDMGNLPPDLVGFDFNWSSCSFEHLGTIEKGFQFLKNQLTTLKPGGWAVHTTEYNISSNDETQDNNETVVYRQRDIEKIANELRSEGHFIEELDYSLGGLPEDFKVDLHPYKQDVHLRLQIDKYIVTSIGLIIRKKI